MKHIKLFFEGFDDNQYYTPLDELELNRMAHSGMSFEWGRLEDMNSSYLDRLKGEYELGVNMYMTWSENLRSIFGVPFGSGKAGVRIIGMDTLGIDNPTIKCVGEIMLFEDEWFVVYIFNWGTQKGEMWKCDQFDGLVELLKDKNIIK
jgi:hypothetical protein